MPNLNKVMLMGNLTRDPELRRTPKGTAVTEIGLAINRFFAREDGQRGEETTFVEVTLWGRQAEIVHEYCRKGRPIYIEGRLQLDSWTDKTTGQQRTKLKVTGENIQFLGSREEGGGGGYASSPQSQGYTSSANNYGSSGDRESGGDSYSASQNQPAPYQQQNHSAPPPRHVENAPSGAMGSLGGEEEDDIPF